MNFINLIITPELLRIIAEIDEFNGGWKVQSVHEGQIPPWQSTVFNLKIRVERLIVF